MRSSPARYMYPTMQREAETSIFLPTSISLFVTDVFSWFLTYAGRHHGYEGASIARVNQKKIVFLRERTWRLDRETKRKAKRSCVCHRA